MNPIITAYNASMSSFLNRVKALWAYRRGLCTLEEVNIAWRRWEDARDWYRDLRELTY